MQQPAPQDAQDETISDTTVTGLSPASRGRQHAAGQPQRGGRPAMHTAKKHCSLSVGISTLLARALGRLSAFRSHVSSLTRGLCYLLPSSIPAQAQAQAQAAKQPHSRALSFPRLLLRWEGPPRPRALIYWLHSERRPRSTTLMQFPLPQLLHSLCLNY